MPDKPTEPLGAYLMAWAKQWGRAVVRKIPWVLSWGGIGAVPAAIVIWLLERDTVNLWHLLLAIGASLGTFLVIQIVGQFFLAPLTLQRARSDRAVEKVSAAHEAEVRSVRDKATREVAFADHLAATYRFRLRLVHCQLEGARTVERLFTDDPGPFPPGGMGHYSREAANALQRWVGCLYEALHEGDREDLIPEVAFTDRDDLTTMAGFKFAYETRLALVRQWAVDASPGPHARV